MAWSQKGWAPPQGEALIFAWLFFSPFDVCWEVRGKGRVRAVFLLFL